MNQDSEKIKPNANAAFSTAENETFYDSPKHTLTFIDLFEVLNILSCRQVAEKFSLPKT